MCPTTTSSLLPCPSRLGLEAELAAGGQDTPLCRVVGGVDTFAAEVDSFQLDVDRLSVLAPGTGEVVIPLPGRLPRKSARLERRPNLCALDRAKQRKVRLLEGVFADGVSVSATPACCPRGSWVRTIIAKSAQCGVSLGTGDLRNLEEFLAAAF